jgi:hypothetical protein
MAKRKWTKEGAHEVLAVPDSDKKPGVIFAADAKATKTRLP